ncbi:acyl-CoA thioesterase [Halalkalibacter alkaliphilus]|uniref:Acyl-CoA thioesterase n=1 Tax=Halalkalibacter alkaliphilus TaxID=2917993 RepID=A0A9X2I5M6_9BACI|nr:thioesterase family protein [Halalkalibacter alkaliphilus]MCL7748716.1 acyl-CoA thioesterase [Halalkalibacter alkaliphilus]
MKTIEYTFEVKWGDTDAAAIVFYPNFYKWMNEASHHYFGQIGFKPSKLFAEEKVGMPLLEANCQFRTPLLFEDIVTVYSTITEIRNKVVFLEHIFKRDDMIVAIGKEVRAWTSFEGTPKAIPVPAKLRENAMG